MPHTPQEASYQTPAHPVWELTLGLVTSQVWLLGGRGTGHPAQQQLELCHVHAGCELPAAVPNLQPSGAQLVRR